MLRTVIILSNSDYIYHNLKIQACWENYIIGSKSFINIYAKYWFISKIIAALFEQCREEQVECSNSYAYYVFGSDMLFSLSTAGLFLHNFYLYYLSNTSRTTKSSVNKKLITSALSWSSILLVMVHWLFERAISENGTSNRSIDQISRYCAVAVYVFW